jgi:transposase
MLPDDECEQVRRAYYIEHQTISAIAKETHHCRDTIRKALEEVPRKPYQLREERPRPRCNPFQQRIEELFAQNDVLPPKQRYTHHKIFEIIQAEGYQGCESRIGQLYTAWKQQHTPPEVFLPLEFEPGQDAQCDWGEAIVLIGGVRQVVQVFVLRLCYSRRTFVMAFPTQEQENFFYAHVQAFKHFGGVPARISYDNLATAVKIATDRKGRRSRKENHTFVAFRSHYLFESHFCTPAQGHEKGQVENGVGFARRNFLVPIPEATSFEALNEYLVAQCLKNDARCMRGRSLTIGQAGEEERPYLRPLPPFDYDCCEIVIARLTPYSQAIFATNRYSVPVRHARQEVTIKAYPFHLDILDRDQLIARHPRCYGHYQDVFDPLHYLPLLEQRPGAFDYAAPLRRWRKDWPACYHQMLRELRHQWPEGRGVQEFVRILQLHEHYPAQLVQEAITQALTYGCIHLDGVIHCLQQLSEPHVTIGSLDLSERPQLEAIGTQPVDLSRYDRLLKQSW